MTASCTEKGSGRGVTVQRPHTHSLSNKKVSIYIQSMLTDALTDKVTGSCMVTDTKLTYKMQVLFIYG